MQTYVTIPLADELPQCLGDNRRITEEVTRPKKFVSSLKTCSDDVRKVVGLQLRLQKFLQKRLPLLFCPHTIG